MVVKKRITALDIAIIFVVLAFIVVICVRFFKQGALSPQYVVVSSHGSESVYPLFKDGEHLVHGILGDTIISVKDKKVQIISSPCPLKTCMNREITKNGESLVCLPNGVAVMLKAVFEEKSEYDAIAY